MKEKLISIFQKCKETIVKIGKRLNKKAVVAVGAVMVLATAVLMNFLLLPKGENAKKEGLDVRLDLSDVSAAVAQKEAEKANAESSEARDVFAEMTLSRKRARDEALEVLTGLCENASIDAEKTDAMAGLQQIAKEIEDEANIESLVMAKGFSECVAVINGDRASVIVRCDGLLDTDVARISEIVYEQSGIHPDNLNIIEAK